MSPIRHYSIQPIHDHQIQPLTPPLPTNGVVVCFDEFGPISLQP
jgi:hypothetical protein